jgi:hypothetical protein
MNFCYTPESGYSPSVNFDIVNGCFRPKAAVREIKKPAANWLV